jgi:hypothetical protein
LLCDASRRANPSGSQQTLGGFRLFVRDLQEGVIRNGKIVHGTGTGLVLVGDAE